LDAYKNADIIVPLKYTIKRQICILAFLLVSLFMMNIADYVYTVRAMSFGIKELNPLINAIAPALLTPTFPGRPMQSG